MYSTALLALGLVCSFFVQSTSSIISGAWILFMASCCLILLYTGSHKKLSNFGIVNLLYLAAILIQGFILAPVKGGGAIMASLIIIPLYYLAMNRDKSPIKSHIIVCAVLLFLLAVNVISQWFFDIPQAYEGRVSWPLINPNNMAALMNIGLVASLGYFIPLAPVFLMALFCTGSKAGLLAGLACGSLVLSHRLRAYWLCLLPLCALAFIPEGAWVSLYGRLPIWVASYDLLWKEPLTGLGLGTFSHYYADVRTEFETMGMFAHNDILHMGIEMGFPVVFVFLVLCSFALTRNFKLSCVFLAVFIHSLIEFQFYLPPIAILLGVLFTNMETNNETLQPRSTRPFCFVCRPTFGRQPQSR